MKRRYSCRTDAQKLSFKLHSRAWGSGERERCSWKTIKRVESTFSRQPSCQTESSEGSYCFYQREVYASLGEMLFLITTRLSCCCNG